MHKARSPASGPTFVESMATLSWSWAIAHQSGPAHRPNPARCPVRALRGWAEGTPNVAEAPCELAEGKPGDIDLPLPAPLLLNHCHCYFFLLIMKRC